MKPRCELFKRLLLGLVVLTMMAIALPACAPEEVAPPEEEAVEGTPAEEAAGEVAPVAGYQIAEADELRIELDSLFSIAVDTGAEVADYCDTFWETWRDGTKEEMLRLAEDHPGMVTRVAEAEAELNYVPTIIDKANKLDIPAWYQDYFSKKEQVAGYLATALKQAEGFLTGVEPMVENMSDIISVGEGILEFWEKVMPEIGSLIDEENYSQARQRVATAADSANDMQNLLMRAYGQAGVPVLPWMSDGCGSLEEVLVLVIDWLEAKEAGDSARVEQVRSAILTFVEEELEIFESIPWDESNTWFETNFGSFLDQITTNTEQAVSLNSETDTEIEVALEAHYAAKEVALEARWTPTADESGQVFYASFADETGDVGQWEEGVFAPPKVVGGHPEIDIKNAHTRVQGDNIIFWLEVEGSISDESGIGYMFDVSTTPESKEGDAGVNYVLGKASCYVRATGEFTYPAFQKSGGGLRIIVPKSAFDSPEVWFVHVMAFAGEGLQDSVGELPPGLKMGE